MHTALIIAASLIVSADPSTTTTSKTSDAKARPPASAKAETRYCMSYDSLVGSRVNKTECRTKAEWRREGVDVDRELKRA